MFFDLEYINNSHSYIGAPSVAAAIREILSYHTALEAKVAVETAIKIVSNVLAHPNDPQKVSNSYGFIDSDMLALYMTLHLYFSTVSRSPILSSIETWAAWTHLQF